MYRIRSTALALALSAAASHGRFASAQLPATSARPLRSTASGSAASTRSAFGAITPDALNRQPTAQELASPAGPGVLHAQVLLDHANFSVGVLDGDAGQNTQKAVRFFQRAHGLAATGQLDSATYGALAQAVGDLPGATQITVGADLLRGPFVRIPNDPYADAKLPCMCYVNALEELDERYHTTAEVLRQLNPGRDLLHLQPETTLWVPNVSPFDASAPRFAASPRQIAEIRVSKVGEYVQALAADGSIVYHFPTTLGSDYNPSPSGHYHVVAIQWRPPYHFDPALLKEADRSKDALLPPGPNSPVGIVWIALTKEHVGIHGTPRPDLIGLDNSHGCVRLANWDAAKLASSIERGVKVDFGE